jgi:hypothetical protein
VAGRFFDTSAIVKRYVREAGTSWVRSLTRIGSPDPIYLARITAVEVCAAVARRQRGASLPPAQAMAILSRFRRHLVRRYQIAEVTPALLSDAMDLAEVHGLRAYDFVQLAAALELNRLRVAAGLGGIILVSADLELNAAATASGLAVDDPNLHP